MRARGSVVIVSWAGYIERGDTDPAFDWVTQFEEDTGCMVENKVAGTSDEMVALMTGSEEYDLVTASGDSSLRLIAGGAVQEINPDLIESWDTVDPRSRTPSGTPSTASIMATPVLVGIQRARL